MQQEDATSVVTPLNSLPEKLKRIVIQQASSYMLTTRTRVLRRALFSDHGNCAAVS